MSTLNGNITYDFSSYTAEVNTFHWTQSDEHILNRRCGYLGYDLRATIGHVLCYVEALTNEAVESLAQGEIPQGEIEKISKVIIHCGENV